MATRIYVNNDLGLDKDANTFIKSSGLYDPNITAAVNTFFVTLKTNSIYSKIKAMWLCLGNNARCFGINGINPSQYNLLFGGIPTISSTGVVFGKTGYADTQLIPSSTLTLNNTHFSYYSRTNIQGANFEFGCNNGSSQRMLFRTRSSINQLDGQMYDATIGQGAIALSAGSLNTSGLFTFSRISSTDFSVYRNTTSLGSINTTGGTLPNLSFALGGFKYSTGITPCNNTKSFCFFSIGDGLTASEITIYYNTIQALQTAAGRQV